jgi:dTDP-4-dehydro-6-deoxy-alpha-D-glucopyranose 2,3-dehydratase
MTETMPPTGLRFLKSALTEDNAFQTTEEAVAWLHATGKERKLLVNQIPFSELGEWSSAEGSGDLVHKSGKFFRIEGIRASTDLGPLPEWDQPIINQPEIGILGIIAREFDGVLHLLMKANMEPGNPFGVQLANAVQATRSNYTQVHQGARPPYLEYFLERNHSRVLVDQLQWEQGSAFLRKRNRNIVVEVTEDVPVLDGFRWMTLGQVKKLLTYPNLVSMDTRTVIACMSLCQPRGADQASASLSPFGVDILASFNSTHAMLSDDHLGSWLTDLKCRHQLTLQHIGLDRITGWDRDGHQISEQNGRFFRVIAVDVQSDSREVVHWSQPLIASVEEGLIAFLATKIDDVLHVLVQARVEPGSADTVTVGPTIQCALGYHSRSGGGEHAPFFDLVQDAAPETIRYSAVQSEEGGRFYRVENEYRVVEIENGYELSLPPNYTWVTLHQLQELLRYGLVSVEARSLLSCLPLT